MPKRILFIFGTRPEAIKLAPLIREFRKHPDTFETAVCVTAQHREMLDQVLDFFEIRPDYDLDLMKPDQSLFDITPAVLQKVGGVLDEARPDVVFVQGDTTTVFISALAAYYKKIRVAHIEAGLRSGDKYSPFPEEMNRILAGRLADYHFAPTEQAVSNLLREGFDDQAIWKVGNTVIDALLLALDIIKSHGDKRYLDYFSNIDLSKRIILITGHRRESFGEPFRNICTAIREIAEKHADVECVYPVHLNPNVRRTVGEALQGIPNVKLIEPLEYPYLVWLMNRSYLVLTDSGGIQEEAPGLGKPVLVMRDVTERQEGIDAGTAMLVGTDRQAIVRQAEKLLTDAAAYGKMANAVNPYGDGKSSGRIAEIMMSVLSAVGAAV